MTWAMESGQPLGWEVESVGEGHPGAVPASSQDVSVEMSAGQG
jgi:hypothetical protein